MRLAVAMLFVQAYAWSVMAADAQRDTTTSSRSDTTGTPASKNAQPTNVPDAPPAQWYTPSGDSTMVVETFDYPKFIGTYPDDIWEGRWGWRYSKTPKKDVYYKIAKEGENYYLTAETTGEAVNFGRQVRVNLRLYQKLRWRWRVHDLPEGADETDSGKNDCAASVRIIIGTNPFVAKAIKYVWSDSLPAGTEIDDGRLKVIVLESGNSKLNQWAWEEVNVYEDYRRLFGGDPRPMDILGLLTDSDNTKKHVSADYDDFIFTIPRPDTIQMVPDFMLQNP